MVNENEPASFVKESVNSLPGSTTLNPLPVNQSLDNGLSNSSVSTNNTTNPVSSELNNGRFIESMSIKTPQFWHEMPELWFLRSRLNLSMLKSHNKLPCLIL